MERIWKILKWLKKQIEEVSWGCAYSESGAGLWLRMSFEEFRKELSKNKRSK